VLDLDLLLWGRETINMLDLQVPHPRMLERAFVLYPMQEIAPQCPLVADFITATCLDNPFIHSQELVLLVE
jgi:7,8-dihydro-6-hydroxymethylpterin-pyrophosphokinase